MGKGGSGLLAAFALSPFAFSLFPPPSSPPWTILLSGDADGLLSPCGCTSPMQGGMRRRATALRGSGRIVRLDNGSLLGGLDTQGRMKGDVAARALDLSKIDAANFSSRDAGLSFNAGAAISLDRLSGGRLVSTSLRPSPTAPLRPWRAAGPFLVGGAAARPDLLRTALRESVLAPDEAARLLADAAAAQGLRPVLLFDGDRAAAAALARAEPRLALLTYRSTGRPASGVERVGAVALATPGGQGKSVVRLAWSGEGFDAATVESLGPDVPNDDDAQRLYAAYLRDVERGGLLDKAPHVPAKGFAGSARCLPCHADAAKAWKASVHAHALRTLEADGHGRDPECVPCHVVGESSQGAEPTMAFLSRARTPRLADVGCESCHGAGAAHAASPWRARLPKTGPAACKPCHTLENSPGFTFEKYWPRVRHGKG